MEIGDFQLKQIRDAIDVEKVDRAIAEFESETGFEFIPVITANSVYKRHLPWMLALIFSVFSIVLIEAYFALHLSDAWTSKWPFYLGAAGISYFAGFWAGQAGIVARLLVSKDEQRKRVEEKADLYFYRLRLADIKSQNAMMVFISVFERRIVIKPDPRLQLENIDGLAEKTLRELQKSFKLGQYESGLLAAVNLLKTELMPHSRKGTGSGNNFPNKLIWLAD